MSGKSQVRGFLSFVPLYIKLGLGVLVVYLLYLLDRTMSLLSF